MLKDTLEDKVQRIGRQILGRARRERRLRLKRSLSLSERLIRWTTQDEFTKERVLRFTKVLPSIHEDPTRIVQHLVEYFMDPRVRPLIRWPLLPLARLWQLLLLRSILLPLLGPLIRYLTVFLVEGKIARRFFIGKNIDEAVEVLRGLGARGLEFTVDQWGEVSHSQTDTDRYVGGYLKLFEAGIRDVSLKLTNLYSEFNPAAWDRTKANVKRELGRIIEGARGKEARITIDMEHYTIKDITLEIFLDVLEEEARRERPFTDLSLAIQSYIRGEGLRDLTLIADRCRKLTAARKGPGRIRPGIRLVKGANWDYDMAVARQRGWPLPHYERKEETDIHFEECARYLLENRDYLKPAFGTHHPRSIALVIALAEALGVSKDEFEFQFLYGIIPEEIVKTLQGMNYRIRLYTPYGELIPGLGYLVRRLLENSSNVSFLRKLRYDRRGVGELLKDPREERRSPSEKDTAGSVEAKLLGRASPDGDRGGKGDLSERIVKLQRFAEALRLEFHSSLDSGRRDDAVRSVHEAIEELRYLMAWQEGSVLSLKGAKNDYVYVPRGEGLVIMEDNEIALAEAVGLIARPLAAGNPIRVSMANVFAETRLRRALARAGIIPREITFEVSSSERNEAYVQGPDIRWIAFQGTPERGRRLRALAFKDLGNGETVKKFISRFAPDMLLDFVVGKSIAENTMVGGYAREPEVHGGLEGFRNVAEVELFRTSCQNSMREAILEERRRDVKERVYPLFIDGKDVLSGEVRPSVNPAHPSEEVGRVHFAGEKEAHLAVKAARHASRAWQELSSGERADFLMRAAQGMEDRRFGLAALMALESAKGWEEALRDVDEAMDFLRYYATDSRREDGRRAVGLHSERGRQHWEARPYGVAAVIAPWNFPLAILAGMSAGALAGGNTVVMKPAEQSPVIGRKLMEIFRDAGLPRGVVNYVAGDASVGRLLVEHPEVDVVAFTGSLAAGLDIKERAEKSGLERGRPKEVFAEMGGQNAIIIDGTADLDETVRGVAYSAFGYSGQKCSACSRIIVLPEIRREFEKAFLAKFHSIVMGDPAEVPGVWIGPLIDAEAVTRIHEAMAQARSGGSVILAERLFSQGEGYFSPAAVVKTPRDSELNFKETFGPFVTLIEARDFDDALQIANSTRYGLTGGVYSETLSHLELSRRAFHVGNLYLNRPIVGAAVGQQPFGGFRLSGIGSKAGGPDYVRQFRHWVS